VVECALTSLAGLPALPALTELQLYSNRIVRLDDAPSALPALRTLSLAGNALTALDARALARMPVLTGARTRPARTRPARTHTRTANPVSLPLLRTPSHARTHMLPLSRTPFFPPSLPPPCRRIVRTPELNVARNRLDFPGACLCAGVAAGGCSALATLNIAGNPAGSLRDVARLAGLPALTALTWRSPLWGAAPVAALPLASPATLTALAPALRSLDGAPADGGARAEAEEMFAKRKVYYSMCAKTARRGAEDVASAARAAAAAALNAAHADAAALRAARGDLAVALDAAAAGEVPDAALSPDWLAAAKSKVAKLDAAADAADAAAAATRDAFRLAVAAADARLEAHISRQAVRRRER
jgi:hypothetical protein